MNQKLNDISIEERIVRTFMTEREQEYIKPVSGQLYAINLNNNSKIDLIEYLFNCAKWRQYALLKLYNLKEEEMNDQDLGTRFRSIIKDMKTEFDLNII